MSDEPSGEDDLPLDRSVHGGQLGLQERVIRAQVLAQLFGRAPLVRVGRYRVLRQIGAGGMAQVYEAEDPEHRRSVAVKVVRGIGGADERAQARMMREARALARLDHPNVVNVYEIGRFDDGVFIAMELVRGKTLAEWQRAGARSWRSIVGMYRAVAEGLAAAHRQGLVHRDFKPDNVLVDDAEQRPKIVDFGLVQGLGTTTEWLDLSAWSFSEAVGPTSGGGKPGAIVGTPWYMSPEQLRGGVVDARSDQYSFCLALHEALFGERPVRPELSFERRYGTGTGHPPPPPMPLPTGGAVPKSIVAALSRGVASDPSSRFVAMDELATALANAVRRRPIWPLAAAGATLLAIGTWVALSREPACTFDGPDPDAVWTDDTGQAVQSGLRSTGFPFVDATRLSLEATVDRHITAIGEQVASACDESEPDPELLDARASCLRSHVEALRTRLDRLRTPEPWDAIVAVAAIAELPSPQRCADPMQLLVPPTEDASGPESLGLERALLCWSMGMGVDGGCDALGRTALTASDASVERPTEAVALRRAAVALELGDVDRARTSLGAIATESMWTIPGVPPLPVLRSLVDPDNLRDPGSLQRLATDLRIDDESRIAYLRAWSRRLSEGDKPQLAQAIAGLEEALRLIVVLQGDGHPRTLGIRLQLAAMLRDSGRLDRSIAILDELRVAADELYGPGHPLGAVVDRLQAEVWLLRGDAGRALAPAEQCRDAFARVLGLDADGSVRCRRLHAVALYRTGRAEAARGDLLPMLAHPVACSEWQAEEATDSLLLELGRADEALARTDAWQQACRAAPAIARASFDLLAARMWLDRDRDAARRHLGVAKQHLQATREDPRWRTIEDMEASLGGE